MGIKVLMTVSRRKVFYLSGFDPRGANHYHGSYKKEAEKYARLQGKDIKVSGRDRSTPHNVRWQIDYEGTFTDYNFLGWDDLVRTQHWDKKPWDLFKNAAKASIDNFKIADWRTAFKLSRAPIITLSYPLIVILGLFVLGLSIANIAFVFIPYTIIRILILLGLIWGGVKIFSFVKAPWLLRLFIINNKLARDHIPAIKERLNLFADYIENALRNNEYDEYLLIGHSNGATFIPLILKTLNERGVNLAPLKIVSLGHCIPLVSLSQKAHYYHEALETAASLPIDWLDIGAPADGTCYALIGPYKGALSDLNIVKNNLRLASPRFHTGYANDTYKKLRANKYSFHFLYLTCPDKLAGEYNYFDLTASPMSYEEFIKSRLKLL